MLEPLLDFGVPAAVAERYRDQNQLAHARRVADGGVDGDTAAE